LLTNLYYLNLAKKVSLHSPSKGQNASVARILIKRSSFCCLQWPDWSGNFMNIQAFFSFIEIALGIHDIIFFD
ncbi:MAG TPA: hypothetical protein PLR24_00240, partial [Saprospiraceae bacterium]|nr:hypothetical protein [Saprospiraceae bacterium]